MNVGLKVKINAVVIRGWNDDVSSRFCKVCKSYRIYCPVHRVYAIRWHGYMDTRSCFQ